MEKNKNLNNTLQKQFSNLCQYGCVKSAQILVILKYKLHKIPLIPSPKEKSQNSVADTKKEQEIARFARSAWTEVQKYLAKIVSESLPIWVCQIGLNFGHFET